MVVGSDEDFLRNEHSNTIYLMYLMFWDMAQRHCMFGYRCCGNVAVSKLPIPERTPHPHRSESLKTWRDYIYLTVYCSSGCFCRINRDEVIHLFVRGVLLFYSKL